MISIWNHYATIWTPCQARTISSNHHAVYKKRAKYLHGQPTRKRRWQFSRTLARQTGMTNDWLKDQRLLSAKDLWVTFTTRLRLGNLCEPPGADLQAGWCGSWVGGKSSRLHDYRFSLLPFPFGIPLHSRSSFFAGSAFLLGGRIVPQRPTRSAVIVIVATITNSTEDQFVEQRPNSAELLFKMT